MALIRHTFGNTIMKNDFVIPAAAVLYVCVFCSCRC